LGQANLITHPQKFDFHVGGGHFSLFIMIRNAPIQTVFFATKVGLNLLKLLLMFSEEQETFAMLQNNSKPS